MVVRILKRRDVSRVGRRKGGQVISFTVRAQNNAVMKTDVERRAEARAADVVLGGRSADILVVRDGETTKRRRMSLANAENVAKRPKYSFDLLSRR